MTLEFLQSQMITAMRNKNKTRKEVISGLVSAVKLAGIDRGCRDNVPEELCNAVLLKELKTVQEMIDTCPPERTQTMKKYRDKKRIIEEFAPKVIKDEEEIKKMILSFGLEVSKENRGTIMKALQGRVDMKVANKVMGDMMA